MNVFKNFAKVALCLCALPAFAANRTNVVEGVTIVIFDEPGTFNFVPDENIASARMLIVGGGGSGGGITGGGGGGGEVVEIASQALNEGSTYTVTVGAGGASANGGNGNTGGNTTFINDAESVSYAALGGGAGSGGWGVYDVGTKLDGGNGGGRGGNGDAIADGGSPTAADGHKGGSSGKYGAGGGGGMAEDGYDSTNSTSMAHWGGAGVTNDITGVYAMYGYGGGGCGGRSGANDGYGRGAYLYESSYVAATAGENGTGGGGGGGHQKSSVSGAGGSGAVIIRYQSSKKMPAEFDIENYFGWVDGESHMAAVTPIWPSDYTLEYSLNGTTSFSSEVPQITTAGSNEVFVAMSGESCTRTVKSAVVWLVDPSGKLLNQYTTAGSYSFTTPGQIIADVLVVGGGGSGAVKGGGGGGGAVLYKPGLLLSSGLSCSIVVGDGGASCTGNPTSGKKGGDSRFTIASESIDWLAPGGGYGGGGWSNVAGGSGGNGGGAGGNGSCTVERKGGEPTFTTGNWGGGMAANLSTGGAGGGGMMGPGDSITVSGTSGNGGAGLTNDITGVDVIYGAGGGGYDNGKGGSGDGSGDAGSNVGVAGNPNTGCGGGACANNGSSCFSGAGGSGTVVIRYAYLTAVPPVIDDSLKGEVMEDNHLRITGTISYLGSGANTCTVTYYMGTAEDALTAVGSVDITESGTSFVYNSPALQRDTVYYWKVVATADTSSSKESDIRHLWSCGKWHFADGIIDDGIWAFAATADASGNMTVGAWSRYPSVASTLDFTKEITDGTATAYVFTKLNPQFSTPNQAGAVDRGACLTTLAASYVAELRLPVSGLTEIVKLAFANCTALTNVAPYLPDCVTTLGLSAFYNVPAVQDLRLMGVTSVPANAFCSAGITSVTFGPGLKSLVGWSGFGCFKDCSNLTNLSFDAEMSGGSFAGEYGHFCNCWNLKGTIDVSGFSSLYAQQAAGAFQSTSYTNIIIGTNTTLLSRGFFTESSIENIYFKGLPPATIGTPFTWNMSATKTIRTYVHKDLLAVSNSANKCWLDYAANGVISHRGTTWSIDYLDASNSSASYKITDPSVRPLLTVEKPGLVLILR